MPPKDFEQLCKTYGETLEKLEHIKMANAGDRTWTQKSDPAFCKLHAEAKKIYQQLNPGEL